MPGTSGVLLSVEFFCSDWRMTGGALAVEGWARCWMGHDLPPLSNNLVSMVAVQT